MMLLPETKGIALPETVDDVEKLGRYRLERSTSQIKAAFPTPGEGMVLGQVNARGERKNIKFLALILSKNSK